MSDIEKTRRESLRWHLLRILDWGRPYSMADSQLWEIAKVNFPDATLIEIRRELDYLDHRTLINLIRPQSGKWHADLLRLGVDLVEYTVECDPGIARPPRYGI